jgi:hypothetical protein
MCLCLSIHVIKKHLHAQSDELQANLGHVCPTCELGVQPPLSIVRRHSLSVCVWIQLHVRYLKKNRSETPPPRTEPERRVKSAKFIRDDEMMKCAFTRKVIEARVALSRSGDGRSDGAIPISACTVQAEVEKGAVSHLPTQ